MMSKHATAFLYTAIIMAVLGAMAEFVISYEMWGNIRFGSDFLQHQDLIFQDPYSFTATGRAWVDTHWLSDLLFAWIHSYFGLMGLSVMRICLLAALFGLCSWHLARYKVPIILSAMMLGLFAVLGLQGGLETLGPATLGCILFAVELSIFISCRDSRENVWKAIALAAIVLLWINIDATAIIGISFILLWELSRLVEARMRRQPVVHLGWMIALLALAASCVTPYGTRPLWLAANAFLSPGNGVISGSHPLHLGSVLGLLYIAFCLPVLCSVRLKSSGMCGMVGMWLCFLLPTISMDYVSFACVGGLLLAAPSLVASLGDYAGIRLFSLEKNIDTTAKQSLVAGVFLSGLLFGALQIHRLLTPKMPNDLPIAAVSAIKNAGLKGNVVCMDQFGDYSLWRLYPTIKVSIDSRLAAVYPKQAISDSFNFKNGVYRWSELLSRYEIAAVLTSPKVASYSLMRSLPQWKLLYEDGVSAVFVPVQVPGSK